VHSTSRPITSFLDPERGLPPQNIEAEEAVLGGLLLDPEAIARVEPILKTPQAFYVHSHRSIYKAILGLSKSPDGVVDLMTVATALKNAPSSEHGSKLDEIGGQIRLANLLDRVVSAANVDQYAQLVQDKYIRRQLIEAARKQEALAYQSDRAIVEVLGESESNLLAVSQQIRTGSVLPLGDVLAETFQEIEDRAGGNIPAGLESGFYDLDAMTQGFQRGDLIIIAARPSMGKTAFALRIAAHAAGAVKVPVFVVSLEMSRRQLSYRLLSALVEIESGRLRTGRIANHEWEPIGHGISQASEWPLFLDESWTPSVGEIASKAKEIKGANGGLGMIVIDYLQLMDAAGSDRVQILSKITRGLKQLALELDVPIIVLSQLSRGVESRTNKRPMMSDLRESGAIEQDADLIMMLYREEYYDPDTPDRGVAEIIITKHRNGPTGTVKLLFQPEYGKFLNRGRSMG
jgi:replicative DNA helicase